MPVLRAVGELGGSGSVEEIREKVIATLKIPDALAVIPHSGRRGKPDGRTELEYHLAWARTDLKQLGYLANSARGVWSLTSEGSKTLQSNNAVSLAALPTSPVLDETQDWRTKLNALLVETLTPAAFERLIQRILRETGFAQVEVTGRSGDGGIDGKGIARINGILSFRIVFQCKRYKGAVSAGEIRDFRGAMQGRADKGLFITTGYFTRDALREAIRDGAIAIDLVDGDKLAEKLKELNLGVRIETVERIHLDREWFNEI